MKGDISSMILARGSFHDYEHALSVSLLSSSLYPGLKSWFIVLDGSTY